MLGVSVQEGTEESDEAGDWPPVGDRRYRG